MNLSDIANIGSFVSAVAVLISLIYLALQVRQAEHNQRSIANQGVATRATDIVMWSTEPHILALRMRVIEGETEFTADEIIKLSFVLRVSILAMQDAYVQHSARIVDGITLEGVVGGVRPLLAEPVYRALWKRNRTNFSPEMQAFVDKLIAETPLAEHIDLVARYKGDLAEVLKGS